MNRALIIQSVDHNYTPYIALTYARHADYAQRCGADYQVFTGVKEAGLHPSWNRIPLFLEALDEGYEKIVWLDADVLVVNPGVNIVTETANDIPFQMSRYAHYRLYGEPHYCNGVMVICAQPETREALQWVWAQRHAPFRPYHIPGLWEQNWVADYIHEHPGVAKDLPQRFNYLPKYADRPEAPVILAWHGEPRRIESLKRALAALDSPPDAMPAADWLPNDPWQAWLASKPKGLDYFPALTRFIRDYKITSVVEIGVRAGYGMAAMLRGNPGLVYLGIDDDREVPGGLKHAHVLSCRYTTRLDTVSFMAVDSQTLTALPRTFDLAYIDGTHSAEAVRHDLELCRPWCRYLLCDDYDYDVGVRRAIQDFCRRYRLPLTYLPTVNGWALMEMARAGEAPAHQRFAALPRIGGAMKYLCTLQMPTYHPQLGTLTPGLVEVEPQHVMLADTLPYLRRVEDLSLSQEEEDDQQEVDALTTEDDPHHVDDPDAA
jgi:hypothetical protein